MKFGNEICCSVVFIGWVAMHKTNLPKAAYKNGRRKCIFCGAYGTTKEHIWPNWLGGYIPRKSTNRTHRGSFAYISRMTENSAPFRWSIESRKKENGDPHTQKLKVVCANCNNGWMSRLQEECKPIIVRCMDGVDISLSHHEASVLSAWATMFTMVVEFKHLPTVAVPQSDRNYLHQTQGTPKNWLVWIGRYDGKRWNGTFNHFGLHEDKQRVRASIGESRPEMLQNLFLSQSTAFVVRNMFLMTFSSVLSGFKFDPLDFAKLFGIKAIWPVLDNRDATHLLVLNDFSADQVSRAFVPAHRKPFVRAAWDTE